MMPLGVSIVIIAGVIFGFIAGYEWAMCRAEGQYSKYGKVKK